MSNSTASDQERLLNTSTEEMLLTFVKMELEKKGLKSAAGRARKAVKDCADRQQGVIDELVRREVDLHNLEIPLGVSLDEEEPEEEEEE